MPPISRLQRAKEYILAHKDESKREQAIGAEVSEAMIGMARRELVAEGLIEPGRSARTDLDKRDAARKAEKAALAVAVHSAVAKEPSKPAQMLDHAAMLAIADMEELTGDDIDDEEVYKRMLKQCIRFAFDPVLHADTRMSASKMWAHLREQKKERQLGPSTPMNFEAGVRRLADLLLACGAQMTMAAATLAFGAPNEGKVPADTVSPAPGASGATPAP